MKLLSRTILSVFSLLGPSLLLHASSPGTGIDITQLGRLIPTTIGYQPREICAPFGMNNAGSVVGRAAINREQQEDLGHAFLSVNGKMTDLGVLPGYTGGSCAFAINDAGLIAGCSGKTQADEGMKDSHAFLYQDRVMTDLGTLGGSYSKAVAVSKRGQVVGISTTATGEIHVFIHERGRMRDLGNFKGYRVFRVNGINDSGEIVGAMSEDLDQETPHAFCYRNGRFHDLGTFGGTSSEAYAVNNAGEIVGRFSVHGKTHAFLYSGGKIKDISGLVDTRNSPGAIATGINNRGEILLMVPENDHTTRNYIYRNRTATDLRSLLKAKPGYFAESVATVNDAGQIVCFGVTPEGKSGFLITTRHGR